MFGLDPWQRALLHFAANLATFPGGKGAQGIHDIGLH